MDKGDPTNLNLAKKPIKAFFFLMPWDFGECSGMSIGTLTNEVTHCLNSGLKVICGLSLDLPTSRVTARCTTK